MPEILFKFRSTSVLPVVQAAATTTAAPGGPAHPNAATGAADFLGQLETALKNLSKTVTKPNLAAPPAAQIAATQTHGADVPLAPADLKDAKPVDGTSEPVPDVLAALGLVPVPIAFVPPAVPVEKTADAAPQSLSAAPSVAADAVQLHAQLELSKLPKPEVQLPMPEVQPRAVAPTVAPTVATAATTPTAPTADAAPTDPAALAPGAANVALRGQSAQHHTAAPTGTVDVSAQVIGSSPRPAQQGAFQQGSADDGRQSMSKKAARVDAAESAPSVTPASDAAIAAAAGSTASNSVTVLPASVSPAEVVSQIAHQADLYRLPGNRGVRIQLHPEGLGGVEVTLRYGVGGALQLHINVEHAATGALVQAGWAELRDALATQGISPHRLVMGITAPNGSSQLDFSGGGSGNQTDSGTTGFAQSQSDQQRQDNSEPTGQRGWNGAVEPTSPSDDSPRVASTTAATSRIDYRA